jgi:hypothetical protein
MNETTQKKIIETPLGPVSYQIINQNGSDWWHAKWEKYGMEMEIRVNDGFDPVDEQQFINAIQEASQ